MKKTFLCLPALFFGFSLHASDGVLEINQVCALNGGCFAGDSAGFPVTIDGSAGVSYRLTGSLDLSAVADTTAIDIDAPYITLDLNGFEIAGPISCTGTGASLDCGDTGGGDGIGLSSNADYVTVRNGTIRNMSRHGIGATGDRLTVKDVRARNNARDGLNGGLDSIAVNCIANENGNDGFQFGAGSVIEQSSAFGNGTDGIRIESSNGVIDNSTARNNGESGFVMGNSSRFGRNSSTGNVLADECGGGICSEKKRFLVTMDSVMGDEALGACPSGFHFASLWEIMDYSNLAYDTVLGRVNDDSGSGPAANQFGWVRSGIEDSGDYNCGTWSGTGDGLEAYLVRPENLDDAGTKVPFWRFETSPCTLVSRPVWCVED